MNGLKLLSLGVALAVTLSACASYPDKVQVAEDIPLIEFEQVQKEDTQFIGQNARWSGVIAGIKNKQNQTQLDVLYYAPSNTGRPKIKDEPIGRFRVLVDGFLEPEIYSKGKSIVALGVIKEKESQKIDEFEYVYPTLTAAKIHLWKKAKQPAQVEFYYGWPGHHPRYYYNGGVRHIYTIGGTKRKQPTGVVKSKDNKQ